MWQPLALAPGTRVPFYMSTTPAPHYFPSAFFIRLLNIVPARVEATRGRSQVLGTFSLMAVTVLTSSRCAGMRSIGHCGTAPIPLAAVGVTEVSDSEPQTGLEPEQRRRRTAVQLNPARLSATVC
jgi:hypothetical protein